MFQRRWAALLLLVQKTHHRSFGDPKKLDNTPLQTENTMNEAEIAATLLYVFSQIK
jgi:hypothetical protein